MISGMNCVVQENTMYMILTLIKVQVELSLAFR